MLRRAAPHHDRCALHNLKIGLLEAVPVNVKAARQQILDHESQTDDPTDPTHPDFDLSEAAPYSSQEHRKPWFLRRWALIVVSALVVVSLVLPYVWRLY
jgi:hypothetical protein